MFLGTSASVLAAAIAGAPRPAPAAEADAALQTPTGLLYGTLALPSTGGPTPVVLIVAGSGPVDRNGNVAQLQSNAYALLASALADRGYASLRYDKRGVGASASALTSESALRLETYADDVVGWLEQLGSDKRFSTLLVAGHSEGSLLGMLAAQKARVDAFVSLEGLGRPAAVVLREQLKPKLAPATYAQVDEILDSLQNGKTVSGVPESDPLFRPSLQPYLISWFKYDPAAQFAKLRVPATIVQGTADVQVSMADANALAKGNPTARLVVVEGMNHVLKHAPDTSSQAAILEGYEDPKLPVDPKVVAAIAGTLR